MYVNNYYPLDKTKTTVKFFVYFDFLHNVSKYATMQFHVGRSSPPPPGITANGQVVPFVSSAKLLGVTIQSH